jgi:hypothetical protein
VAAGHKGGDRRAGTQGTGCVAAERSRKGRFAHPRRTAHRAFWESGDPNCAGFVRVTSEPEVMKTPLCGNFGATRPSGGKKFPKTPLFIAVGL